METSSSTKKDPDVLVTTYSEKGVEAVKCAKMAEKVGATTRTKMETDAFPPGCGGADCVDRGCSNGGGLHHASLAVVNSRCSPVSGLDSSSVYLRMGKQVKDGNNDGSFMQDSVDFQWCMEHEEEYQREMISSRNAPRSIFEGSLLDSGKAYCFNVNVNSYEVIARNIDANLAQIDMENFKSEDINTILALPDMLDDPRDSLHQAITVQSEAGEECASVSDSLLREIEYEEDDDIHSGERSHHGSDGCYNPFSGDEALFSSGKQSDIDEQLIRSTRRMSNSKMERSSKRTRGTCTATGTATTATGISVDSLDMSSLEENTNDVVMRCTEQDKTKYTIAFEESLSSLTTFTDSNEEEDGGITDEKRDAVTHGHQFVKQSEFSRRGQLVQSAHSYITWNRLPNNAINICQRHGKDETIQNDINTTVDPRRGTTKQSKSLPNIITTADLHGRFDYGMVPLYDLNNCQFPSSGSDTSGGSRPLVRRFFQNHISPSSSAQTSPSYSYESQSQDSASGRSGLNSPSNKSCSALLRGMRDANNYNNNNIDEVGYDNGNGHYVITTGTATEEDDNSFEDSLIMNGTTTLPPPKTSFHRLKQASPIKEEEEPLSDSSRADVTMKSETDEQSSIQQQHNAKELDSALYSTPHAANVPTAVAYRSSSVERVSNPHHQTPNPYHAPSQLGRYPNESNNGVYNVNRPHRVVSTTQFSKECSPSSSGYVSSRQGSFEWFRKAYTSTSNTPVGMKPKTNGSSVSFTTTRSASTQVPVHIQDKQVQTSLITSSKSMEFILKDEAPPACATADREVPLRNGRGKYAYYEEKPFYVCYPNYSLPDLSFLGDLTGGGGCGPGGPVIGAPVKGAATAAGINEAPPKLSKVFLSPTKLRISSRDKIPPPSVAPSAPIPQPSLGAAAPSSAGGRCGPGTSPKRGVRPKSCNDYEAFSNQNFSHIKDWDSLKVLLPNEFKTLIERLNGIQKTTPAESTSKVAPTPTASSQYPGVQLRSPHKKRVLRKTLSSEHDPSCSCTRTATGASNKRFSLQEPFGGRDPTYVFGADTSPIRKKTMSKSATMPPCHCFCQWHHSHCCSCFHHCCPRPHFGGAPHCLSPTKHPIGPTIPVEPVDELSEIISLDMTLKEVTNIIGGHSGSRTLSPTKPMCEPISEQNEEIDVRCGSRKANEDSSSFKELRKHWENLANTPTTQSCKGTKSKAATPEPILDEEMDSGNNNTIGAPVATSSRSQTPQAQTKPKIPAKPATCAIKSKNLHQPAGDAGSKANPARPTSLNTHNFKSMIPIAKSSKSPPGANKISSPTNNNVN